MSGAVFFSGTFSTKGCPVSKASFTHSLCICVRINSNKSHFMQRGQGLSLLDVKEVNNWVNNPCALCRVQESSPESVLCSVSQWRKVFRAAPVALLLPQTFHPSIFIHDIFIIISPTIITIINHSSFWIVRLCRAHFCLPSSWCFSGMRLYHSAASQQEPLFPHLFSLSPLMICSDRYDSWINMQT